MTREEFETIKTILKESQRCQECELDIEEWDYGQAMNRLKDGENLVDLYMEFRGYLYTMGNDELDWEWEDNRFWGNAQLTLVDK